MCSPHFTAVNLACVCMHAFITWTERSRFVSVSMSLCLSYLLYWMDIDVMLCSHVGPVAVNRVIATKTSAWLVPTSMRPSVFDIRWSWPLTFWRKMFPLVTRALGNVHTNFGFSSPVYSQVKIRYGTDRQSARWTDRRARTVMRLLRTATIMHVEMVMGYWTTLPHYTAYV